MGIFGRKRHHIPPGYGRYLSAWGEHLVGRNPHFDHGLLASLEVMDYASADPEGFVEALAAETRSYDAAAALGACETVNHMFRLEVDSPAWWELVDRANQYLRQQGVRWRSLKPYQQQRWVTVHGPGTW